MGANNLQNFIKNVLENSPADWLKLSTHRLDIYDESLAKTQFLEQFEKLFSDNIADKDALASLPTAYDYIRLGHPLSCILEWTIAKDNNLNPDSVISFSTRTMGILAVLRKNLLDNKATQLLYTNELPANFNAEILKQVYGYKLECKRVKEGSAIAAFEGSTIFLLERDSRDKKSICDFDFYNNIDFYINTDDELGSILIAHGEENESYISEIQHVRRRETISMTPINCLRALQAWVGMPIEKHQSDSETAAHKKSVIESIKKVTEAPTDALVCSSGLSTQYAIMMGLVHYAQEQHPGQAIKFVVPPNCYGGTNDQARRVAACLKNVEVVDLPVDGDNDMVQSVETVLDKIALENAVPFIIAEIPTNPRVEVPNLENLRDALSQERKTEEGEVAVGPVFILDQTFCPNYHFLGEGEILSEVRTLSYASGSKFPSGGKCTAGYVVGNSQTSALLTKIEWHMALCDNEATALQYELLAQNLPSMNERIADAYNNTREFVNFIQEKLPEAKINFVSEELAAQGFTPSVFSLDLPTKGETAEEKENYKRELNHKLIKLMITEIPTESKYCVSYGQLKGCYWTIPATSTQGTTKEGDKDYIARVALSANMDLAKHKAVFADFVASLSS